MLKGSQESDYRLNKRRFTFTSEQKVQSMNESNREINCRLLTFRMLQKTF
jgi:hypothetical protein